ncbi:mitogen-activated protein kinase [Paraconiothyrium brasiliense]|uniref:cyclin-dependent kinase n=1 Tax=Paraconiothyrium brasiliense TaxID=300254 RepID=A0ABR3QSY7_9PLEO
MQGDYEKLCEEAITSLGAPAVDFHQYQDEDYVPTPSGMDIGEYRNAVYHREGLFSVIYKAITAKFDGYFASFGTTGKVVALKMTTPSHMEPPHDSKREARILALAASDRVVPLLDTFNESGSRFVLVFPFVQYDLSRLLQDRKLSKAQIKRALKDLFSALTFVHERGIIHRDIKPSNILLKSLDGPAYLIDFGIAWAPDTVGSEPTKSKITDVGTTCYRPPELLFGNNKYGCELDLWAAGCTVAEALVPDHPTLFDSGELGSDLALISSMFSKLGTPDLSVWPEAAGFPDWGKVQFIEFPTQPWSNLLPGTLDIEQDLVSQLVRYESGSRLKAAQVRLYIISVIE